MPNQSVIKATITKLSKSGSPTGTKVTAQFNPKEFQTGKQIEWTEKRQIGSDFPQVTFSGGKAQDMILDFLFDTTDSGTDVRKSYKALLDIASVDPQRKNVKTGKGEPALCRFQWGRLLSFDAAIKDISQTFTMFKSDGTPVRAKVKLTIMQVDQSPQRQNPTSYTEPRKTWVVHEGERLDWIAYQEYGDAAYWRHIAETNNLADPTDLHPGQILQLVPVP